MHSVKPSGQVTVETQAPFSQIRLPQALPHAPQLVGLVLRSAQ